MPTYKETRAKQKVYVILKNDKVIGVFSNLKKVTDFMNDEDFYSYSTLTKMKKKVVKRGVYTLYIETLK